MNRNKAVLTSILVAAAGGVWHYRTARQELDTDMEDVWSSSLSSSSSTISSKLAGLTPVSIESNGDCLFLATAVALTYAEDHYVLPFGSNDRAIAGRVLREEHEDATVDLRRPVDAVRVHPHVGSRPQLHVGRGQVRARARSSPFRIFIY